MTAVEIRRVRVAPDVELTVRCAGRGSPAYLLVHGLASNARMWDGVVAALDAPSVAVDQRGHGLSDKPDSGYDIGQVVADLVVLLRSLRLDRPVVVGQSWGANVVLELGCRHPDLVRAVVCVDGALVDFADRWPRWEDCLRDLAPPGTAGIPYQELEHRLRAAHPDWPEPGLAGMLACFERRPDGTAAPWLTYERHLEVLRGLWEHRPSQCWPRMRVPVRYLIARGGAGQRLGPVDEVTAAVLASLPLALGQVDWMDGEHDLHAQHPVEVAAVLRSVLAAT